MTKDKKRKLPFQVEKFPVHTFHYYSPPNVKSKDLYNFKDSDSSPFSFLKSNNSSQLPSSTLSQDQSQYLLDSFEKTINSIDKDSFKKQRIDNDRIFQDLNNNRKEMNNSLNNFQRLNNNLFDNNLIYFISENSNNNNNTNSSNNDNSNSDNDNSNGSNDNSYNDSNYNKYSIKIKLEDGSDNNNSDDFLFSFLDDEDDLNGNNTSTTSTVDYDLSFISPSTSNETTNISTTFSPSSASNISTSAKSNLDLNQFLYDGDLYDKALDSYKSN